VVAYINMLRHQQNNSPVVFLMQAVPPDISTFDKDVTSGKLGFVTFKIHRKQMKGETLTQYLESVVMLPASIQHRVTSCKLLVRMMLRRKLASMQEDLFPALAASEHSDELVSRRGI
jgi:hypothetical protein